MPTSPPIHHWNAGDPVSAIRMNEIKASIDWLRNPPMTYVQYLGAPITLPTTWTKIPFDTEVSDDYDMWDSGTPDEITVTIAGWYAVESVISVTANATDSKLTVAIWKNNAEVMFRFDQQGLPSVGGNSNIRKEATMFLNVGDQIELYATVSAGARQIVSGGSNECPTLRMRWVSD